MARKTTKHKIAENLWLPVVFAILSLALGVIISQVQDKIGW